MFKVIFKIVVFNLCFPAKTSGFYFDLVIIVTINGRCIRENLVGEYMVPPEVKKFVAVHVYQTVIKIEVVVAKVSRYKNIVFIVEFVIELGIQVVEIG
jgi:hypothetical protein